MKRRMETSPASNQSPRYELLNRQRAVAVDMDWMDAAVHLGLSSCLQVAAAQGGALAEMEEIVVTLVSNRRIAALHREFMGIPGPTDVITFQHGEVVVSVETAAQVARERSTSFHGELLLYVVHGFLHLSGMDDVTDALRKEMHRIQEQICSEVIEAMPRTARERS